MFKLISFDGNGKKIRQVAYIVTEEKPREVDGISTNLALSDLITNALPDINSQDTSSKSGLIAISENVCITSI